jgi:hypothetical protein
MASNLVQRQVLIPIPNKKWVVFLFGIGMRDRMSRRNAKHCERRWRNQAARCRRQIKIAGRNFYLESE